MKNKISLLTTLIVFFMLTLSFIAKKEPKNETKIVISSNFSVEAVVQDEYITLERLESMGYNFKYKVVDSVKIVDKKFVFKVKKGVAENYRLYFSVTGQVIPMVLGEQDVTIKDINFENVQTSYTLAGTKDMENLDKIRSILGKLAADTRKLEASLDNAQAKGDKKKQKELIAKAKVLKSKSLTDAKTEWTAMIPSIAVCFAPALLDPTNGEDLKYLRSLSAKMKPVANTVARKRFVTFINGIVGSGEEVTPKK